MLKQILSVGLIAFWGVISVVGWSHANPRDLRITSVDPHNDQVVVTNTGPAFTTSSNYPFCHRFNYGSRVPAGTAFAAGESQVFTVTGLNDADSDLWLYESSGFTDAANIIHGLKYGPQTNIGRTGLATVIGLWPSAEAVAPSIPPGAVLVYDGAGNEPTDWFIDATPAVPVIARDGGFRWPRLGQNFEASALGDPVNEGLDGWVLVNEGSPANFNAFVVGDVHGVVTNRGASHRWLRIHDRDGVNQNRFDSNPVTAGTFFPGGTGYTLSFFFLTESDLPVDSATMPRLVIEHDNEGSFVDSWGIELAGTGMATGTVSLVVIGNGGPEMSVPMGSIMTGPGTGWYHVELTVDFDTTMLSATLNGHATVSAPIELTGNLNLFRFGYRGGGEGNIATLLLDDIALAPIGLSRLSISPSSGSLLHAPSIGLALNLQAASVTATSGAVWFDGVDITAQFDPSLDFAALGAGGAIPLPNAAMLLTPGSHILRVDINLSDRTTVSDQVLWNIASAPNPEP